MAGLVSLDRRPASRLTSVMIAEIDIWRTAGILINRHGDTADLEARRRADDLGGEGNRGMRTWLRILTAIDALQNVQPGETEQ
jgi:hypothetical protein